MRAVIQKVVGNTQRRLLYTGAAQTETEAIDNEIPSAIYQLGSTMGEESMERKQSDEKLKTMMTPRLSASLTKAGYGLVGNHSAVKICRWTKKQLQGRGGCYKHTFYGIESHRCMETSTFLACANRCVFCWRHHTHPVAKDFSRWVPDPPEMIIEDAIKTHQSMIKPLKGLEGVTKERYEEGMTPRHCALSLVGEPIVYPYINEFVRLLHGKGISSFIVTNGQHPEAIEGLTTPVTQLYVSVDAPDPDTLKLIGRPLFKDYWERLQASLYQLSKRRERTVARLTIVKRWNDKDVEGYAKLIRQGQPDFVEVKAFTYPGPTASIKEAELTMGNCPTGPDVLSFSKQLMEALKEEENGKQWEIASLHLHSNCVLLASTDYRSESKKEETDDSCNQKWNIWIDYKKFHELVKENIDDKMNTENINSGVPISQQFSSRLASMYTYPSPAWTLPNSTLGGFDPKFDTERWINQLDNRQLHEKNG